MVVWITDKVLITAPECRGTSFSKYRIVKNLNRWDHKVLLLERQCLALMLRKTTLVSACRPEVKSKIECRLTRDREQKEKISTL